MQCIFTRLLIQEKEGLDNLTSNMLFYKAGGRWVEFNSCSCATVYAYPQLFGIGLLFGCDIERYAML